MSRFTLLLCVLALACSSDKDGGKDKAAKNQAATNPDPAIASVKEQVPPPKAAPPTYQDELAKLDARLGAEMLRLEKMPTSSLVRANLAAMHSSRGKLTGNYEEYDKAQAVLDPAFEVKGAGPFLTRASLRYTLHDMDGAMSDLASAMAVPPTSAAQFSLRGSVHFHSGRYAEALKDLDAAVAMDRNPSTLARLALYHWKTGDFDKAETLYVEADSRYHGRENETRAWSHLILGLMDLERGRFDDALAHYEQADAEMTGWWLIREHMAEIHFLKGDLAGAASIYKDVVAETGSPELMAAYADVLEAQGNAEEAEKHRSGAAAEFETRLKKWPSASSGHALAFFLESGDPKRALELALENFKRRPGGEAATLLASAYLGAKDVKNAAKTIAKVSDSPYRTAEYHVVASEVYAAKGDKKRAQEEREQAMKIDQSVEALEAAP